VDCCKARAGDQLNRDTERGYRFGGRWRYATTVAATTARSPPSRTPRPRLRGVQAEFGAADVAPSPGPSARCVLTGPAAIPTVSCGALCGGGESCRGRRRSSRERSEPRSLPQAGLGEGQAGRARRVAPASQGEGPAGCASKFPPPPRSAAHELIGIPPGLVSTKRAEGRGRGPASAAKISAGPHRTSGSDVRIPRRLFASSTGPCATRTGHWALATGHWPLATGHWPPVTIIQVSPAQ
jgi:hypothetical protein